jgi:hypothetical protein
MRIAGTNVRREIKIAVIGAKTAESWAQIITIEYIVVISFFSASSTKRQCQEFCVTPLVPFNMPAARKNQKFYARHQIRAGMHHASMSKMAVAFLLPSLSVMGPLKKENTIWDTVLIVTRNPTRVSLKPIASM